MTTRRTTSPYLIDLCSPPALGTVFMFPAGAKAGRRPLPRELVFRGLAADGCLALEEADGAPWPDGETLITVQHWNLKIARSVEAARIDSENGAVWPPGPRGVIDDKTPRGRRFEFGGQRPATEDITIPPVVVFVEIHDGGFVHAETPDGDPFPESVFLKVEQWNEVIAPLVTGFTDPPSPSGASAGEPAGTPTPKQVGDNDEPPEAMGDGPVGRTAGSDALFEELSSANRGFRAALVAYDVARENAKERHKDLEEAQAALNAVVGKIVGQPGAMPLFENGEKSLTTKGTKDSADGSGSGDPSAQQPNSQTVEQSSANEAWRSVRLADLGPIETGSLYEISPRALKAMAEHEPSITTLGELTDWQQAKGDWWAKDVKGLGPKAREEIEKACEAYWEANPKSEFRNPKSGDGLDELEIICHGKRPEALAAITRCGDAARLYAASEVGLKGDWRRAAVARRLDELQGQGGGE